MLYGRPVRFLALVATGWLGWRAFMLWPDAPTAQLLDLPLNLIEAGLLGEAQAAPLGPMIASRPQPAPSIGGKPTPAYRPQQSRRDPDRIAFAYAALTHFSSRFVADDVELGRLGDQGASQIAVVPPLSLRRATDRWQASAWLVTRGGTVPGSRQLGGSQAGVLVRHALTERIGGYARATAPLSGVGSELALGMDVRPGDAPVRLIAESRFGLEGIAGGPAVGVVAGIGPQPALAAHPEIGIDVEAYGQAGSSGEPGQNPMATAMCAYREPWPIMLVPSSTSAWARGQPLNATRSAWISGHRSACGCRSATASFAPRSTGENGLRAMCAPDRASR